MERNKLVSRHQYSDPELISRQLIKFLDTWANIQKLRLISIYALCIFRQPDEHAVTWANIQTQDTMYNIWTAGTISQPLGQYPGIQTNELISRHQIPQLTCRYVAN